MDLIPKHELYKLFVVVITIVDLVKHPIYFIVILFFIRIEIDFINAFSVNGYANGCAVQFSDVFFLSYNKGGTPVLEVPPNRDS